MITLETLRGHLEAKATSPQALARCAPDGVVNGITQRLTSDRIEVLRSKNKMRRPEPWLWEAFDIANMLGLDAITPLIEPGISNLDHLHIDEELVDDIDIWNSGIELPLRIGIRIARTLGLSDPYDVQLLVKARRRIPAMTEAWSIAATGERTPTLRSCPWCNAEIVGDAGHLPTCLPNAMWGARALDVETLFRGTKPPEPLIPGDRQIGRGLDAPGLKAARKRMGVTQVEMAAICGYSYAHYTKIEAVKAKLTPDSEARIRQNFPSISRRDLFLPAIPSKVAPREQAEPPVLEPTS